MANPLKWLVGLSASYFSQLNIVQVLNMILFPPVPASYTAPTLTLSLIDSSTKLVGITFTNTITLTYVKNSSGTASGYTFNRTSPTIINAFYTVATNSLVVATGLSHFTTTPTTFIYSGTNSHVSGNQLYDTYGNPTPIPAAVGAVSSMIPTPPTVQVKSIFPIFYGKVTGSSKNINTMTAADIAAGFMLFSSGTYPNGVPTEASGSIQINFNTNSSEKGWFAVPVAAGSQTVQTYESWEDSSNSSNVGDIPGGGDTSLFFQSPVLVTNVPVHPWLTHNYNLYMFYYNSSATVPFIIYP